VERHFLQEYFELIFTSRTSALSAMLPPVFAFVRSGQVLTRHSLIARTLGTPLTFPRHTHSGALPFTGFPQPVSEVFNKGPKATSWLSFLWAGTWANCVLLTRKVRLRIYQFRRKKKKKKSHRSWCQKTLNGFAICKCLGLINCIAERHRSGCPLGWQQGMAGDGPQVARSCRLCR